MFSDILLNDENGLIIIIESTKETVKASKVEHE